MISVIHIFGRGRSGSTMFDLMLGGNTSAFSCGEVYALFRPWRRHHFQPVCGCGDDNCPVWNHIDKNHPEEFHTQIAKQQNVTHVVDSSKNLRWIMDSNKWNALAGNKVINLLIYKKPLDAFYSYHKRGVSFAKWRYGFFTYHRKAFRSGLPFVTVDYEDLVNDPQKTIKNIDKFIGLPYESDQTDFWKFKHHHLFGSSGTKSQVGGEKGKIQKDQYGESFLKKKTYYENKINDSRIVRSIMNTLEERNINNLNAQEYLQEEYILQKPLWYYCDQVKGAYRKKFPES